MDTLSKVSECLTCNTKYTKVKPWQKYCSPLCQSRHPSNSKKTRKRNQDRRDKIAQYKLERGCSKCGYKDHHAALDFNHLDPSTKLFNIGPCASKPWHLIEAEMAKCEILCSNCHRIYTYENHPTRLCET